MQSETYVPVCKCARCQAERMYYSRSPSPAVEKTRPAKGTGVLYTGSLARAIIRLLKSSYL